MKKNEIKIVAKEVTEEQFGNRCDLCSLTNGKCSEIKSFLVNSYDLPNCWKGYIYKVKS